jgi:hypothetical protein
MARAFSGFPIPAFRSNLFSFKKKREKDFTAIRVIRVRWVHFWDVLGYLFLIKV